MENDKAVLLIGLIGAIIYAISKVDWNQIISQLNLGPLGSLLIIAAVIYALSKTAK